VKNYLNFQIKNFEVSELGSIQDAIDRQNAQVNINDDDESEDGDLV